MRIAAIAPGLMAACLCLAGTPARGEEEPVHPMHQKVSLDFKGGTVADYVEAVHKAASSSLNIVMEPKAMAVSLQPIRLQNVPVGTALYALGSATDHQVEAEVNFGRVDIPCFVLARKALTELAIISLAYITRDNQALKDEPEEVVKPETVLTALDAALALGDPSQGKPRVKFHPETALLFVKGTPEQVQLARNMTQQVNADVTSRRHSRMQKRGHTPAEELQEALARLGAEVEALKKQVAGTAPPR